MAGLSSQPVALPVGGTRRGQLLLVGAFGLAVLLLVLAGVLNTATYTESLATRGGDLQDGRDVAAFQADAERTVRTLVRRVNANEAMSVDAKRRTVRESALDWSDGAGRHHAVDVTGTNVTVLAVTEGARIRQEDERAFESAGGEGNWTLATGVSDTRSFRMQVTNSSLESGNCDVASCFELVANDTDSPDTWRLSLNRTTLTVDGPESGTCEAGGDPVRINVTAGTVGGEECAPLSFADGLSDYRIEFRNGSNARGTYRLTVRGDAETANLNADSPPTYREIVYDVAVRITYRTPRLSYEAEPRISGGGSDG